MASRFRSFRVRSRVEESATITSFHLEPLANDPIEGEAIEGGAIDDDATWRAAPGQYLTLRLPTAEGPLLKTYSVSGDTADPRDRRITVKREEAPPHAPGAPPGRGSNWLHEHAHEGTRIEVAAPRGRFVLDEDSERPVLLLSGGVGQTPLLSMLHALARTERAAWYIHACENGDVHAMHAEVEALVGRAPDRLRQHLVYRTPTEADRRAGRFHASGFVDRALLQSLLPLDDYDCYLCGPVPFMVAVFRLLRGLGVPESRIAHEFFGKAKPLARLAAEAEADEARRHAEARAEPRRRPAAGSRAPAALAALANLTDPDARAARDEPDSRAGQPGTRPSPAPTSPAPADRFASPTDVERAEDSAAVTEIRPDPTLDTHVVSFARSGVTARWHDGGGTLLDLAEASGLAPAFSCRSGICDTCRCTVLEGEVDYLEAPLTDPGTDHALICCSRPKGRVVLDL